MGVGHRTVARAAGIVKDAPDLEQAILDGTLKLGAAEAIRKLPEEKRKQAVESVESGKSRTAKRVVRPPNAQAPTRKTPAADKPQVELTRFRAQVMAFAGAGAVSARSSPGRPAAVGWLEPLDDRGPRIDQSERGVEPRHRDVRVRRHCGRRRRAGADRGATRDAAPYDADV